MSPVELPPIPEISREELLSRLRDPRLTIVNVLPRVAFDQARIAGSISIPVDEIASRAAQELPDRAADIVVYCGGFTCPLAGQAAGILKAMGYLHVRDYPGGIEDWRAHRLPIEGGEARRPSGRPGHQSRPASLATRLADASFTTLGLAWLAIVIASGAIYWSLSQWTPLLLSGGESACDGIQGLPTAFYFSFVTALSIGFGDVVPVGAARILAIAEAIMGLLLFGALVSKLVSQRQEQLIEEIHRLSFEDRLGRFRTNLHLVLSELQSVARECQAPSGRSEQVQARAESVTMVLAGELRALHDLLYRPRQEPEEAVLESILATMAMALNQLGGISACGGERSPMLEKSLREIQRLASEICGECVPHDHSAEIQMLMDGIKASALRIIVIQ